jgi:hypothetical protein
MIPIRNKPTCREVINFIIDIIEQNGDDKSDGECIDEIWLTLEYNGYIPKGVHSQTGEENGIDH